MEEICRHCGSITDPIFSLRPDTPHYGEYRCAECNRHLKWEKKPKNEDKRGKNKRTAKSEGVNRCQLCQRTVDMLGKNEVIDCHHVIEIVQGGEDELNNIWWLCTSCHKEVHHRRAYMMKGHVDKFDLIDLRSCMERDNVPQNTRAILEKIFIKSQEGREL